MRLLTLIFWLPLILWNTVVPVNRHTYKPSTEEQRKRSQRLRNDARLAIYKLKKAEHEAGKVILGKTDG